MKRMSKRCFLTHLQEHHCTVLYYSEYCEVKNSTDMVEAIDLSMVMFVALK